jgi:oxygen-independent coproporphyrinogen-3 oxidase
MNLYIINHSYHYEIENLCRVFYPDEKIYIKKEENTDNIKDEFSIITKLTYAEENISLQVSYKNNITLSNTKLINSAKDTEREMAIMLFLILSKATGYTPPWGILTGVRPIKLINKLISDGGEEYAKLYFKDKLLVSEEKINLSLETAQTQKNIISLSSKNSYSLYVSIPFCPTRCSYCSFVSQSIGNAAKLIPEYLDLLCSELEQTAKIANKLGLKLKSLYIGGGTPTTLTSEQLRVLLSVIRCSFDIENCLEFTVEAGRPDTVTIDKLKVIKEFGATRISINPQTMNNDILNLIGRNHSSQQTIEAINKARCYGFDNINMDLIAGLPGDTKEGFKNTLKKILEIDPENITIHTLALKRSSSLNQNNIMKKSNHNKDTQNMIKYAVKQLKENNYTPYYLYRQSRTVGNLENTGFSKPGYEGIYNIYMMDETHTVLACGAGAVTKLNNPNDNNLVRIFNYKYPYEYNKGFKEILARKEQVKDFYERLI